MRERYGLTCILLSLLLFYTLLRADPPQIPDVLTDEINRLQKLMASPIADYRIEGTEQRSFNIIVRE